MFQFDTPWFALLLPLPFLIRKLRLPLKEDVEEDVPQVYFPGLDRIKETFPSYGSVQKKTSPLFFIVLSLVWCSLVLALMQPEKVDQFKQVTNEGYDLMLAVDISSSMQALDFSSGSNMVSRLDVVKSVVGKFVEQRNGVS